MARIANTINKSHILLVEGEDDRGFFEQVCKTLQLNLKIEVAPPKDYQDDYEENLRNGKQGALRLLDNLLPELLDEEAITKRLAIIIDADYKTANGLGYQKTLAQIFNIANEYGFNLSENQSNGLIFKHEDDAINFGVWIMPNNNDEGMLEDFIKSCIHNEEQALFNHAINTVNQLTSKKFKDHHYSKAEIATWLAWQKVPSHGLYIAIKDKLLNEQHSLFQQLGDWLKYVYLE
ncbi:MAG: DUF3226 domain-containing protein [Methylococcaceae bacterium]